MVTTVLECECGFEASAEDEVRLVVEIRRHALEQHDMTLSLVEARLLASRAVALDGSGRASPRGVGKPPREEK